MIEICFASNDFKEINHRTAKLVVGIIALTLAGTAQWVAGDFDLRSISHSYHAPNLWSQNIFVGALISIATFLVAYNGFIKLEKWLSKVAAVAAILIAFFPCSCKDYEPIVPVVHGAAAAVLFIILGVFCLLFAHRAHDKVKNIAKDAPLSAYAPEIRRWIYIVCAVVIFVSVILLGLDKLTGMFSAMQSNFVFVFEENALIAFGISWLVASRILPVFCTQEERAGTD